MKNTEPNLSRKGARLLVVDDHPLLRDSLIKLVCSEKDIVCCGEADNVADAKRLVEETKPDLMLLDLRLKSGDALDLIKSMKVEQPELKILVISQHDEMLFAERALRAGANGYLMKLEATEHIMNALREVLAGNIYLSAY